MNFPVRSVHARAKEHNRSCRAERHEKCADYCAHEQMPAVRFLDSRHNGTQGANRPVDNGADHLRVVAASFREPMFVKEAPPSPRHGFKYRDACGWNTATGVVGGQRHSFRARFSGWRSSALPISLPTSRHFPASVALGCVALRLAACVVRPLCGRWGSLCPHTHVFGGYVDYFGPIEHGRRQQERPVTPYETV
jgi:hypothetical protein